MERGLIPDPLRRLPAKRIVAPVDFSETSLTALAAAISLGRRWKSHLELFHVNEPPPEGMLRSAEASLGMGEEDRYYRHLQSRVRELAKGYGDVSVRIEDGYPKPVLAALAETGRADLIVMGTHGRAGVERLILGSAAEASVRAARSPLLTVPRRVSVDWPRRILVPVVDADYSDRAVLYAAALADCLRAGLWLVHAADNAAQAARFSSVEEHIASVVGPRRFTSIERLLALGKPAEAILRTSDSSGCDLIVLAAHSKPFWEGMILGTTAERVLRHARVPVWSIPSIAIEAPAAAVSANGKNSYPYD